MTKAFNKAKKENKIVFVIFSGLEWCGPCKRYDKNIVQTSAFKNFAKQKFVFVTIDRKRNGKTVVEVDGKKTSASKSSLKDVNKKYPHRGVPYSIMLASNGEKLYDVLGGPTISTEEFVETLKSKIK